VHLCNGNAVREAGGSVGPWPLVSKDKGAGGRKFNSVLGHEGMRCQRNRSGLMGSEKTALQEDTRKKRKRSNRRLTAKRSRTVRHATQVRTRAIPVLFQAQASSRTTSKKSARRGKKGKGVYRTPNAAVGTKEGN